MAAEEARAANNSGEKLNIAVIDLNQTFYNKSSKEEFYKFILTKEPKRFKFIFEMAYFKILNKLNQIRQTEFKENFFNYLDRLPPEKVKAYASEFWRKEYPENFNQELLKRLDALKAKGVKIICATGGLEIYVNPLFELYRIDGVISTRVNYTGKTYVVEGEACKGEEKIRRLDRFFKGKAYTIVEAYSDQKEEIVEQAEKGFLVKNGVLTPADSKKK